MAHLASNFPHPTPFEYETETLDSPLQGGGEAENVVIPSPMEIVDNEMVVVTQSVCATHSMQLLESGISDTVDSFMQDMLYGSLAGLGDQSAADDVVPTSFTNIDANVDMETFLDDSFTFLGVPTACSDNVGSIGFEIGSPGPTLEPRRRAPTGKPSHPTIKSIFKEVVHKRKKRANTGGRHKPSEMPGQMTFRTKAAPKPQRGTEPQRINAQLIKRYGPCLHCKESSLKCSYDVSKPYSPCNSCLTRKVRGTLHWDRFCVRIYLPEDHFVFNWEILEPRSWRHICSDCSSLRAHDGVVTQYGRYNAEYLFADSSSLLEEMEKDFIHPPKSRVICTQECCAPSGTPCPLSSVLKYLPRRLTSPGLDEQSTEYTVIQQKDKAPQSSFPITKFWVHCTMTRKESNECIGVKYETILCGYSTEDIIFLEKLRMRIGRFTPIQYLNHLLRNFWTGKLNSIERYALTFLFVMGQSLSSNLNAIYQPQNDHLRQSRQLSEQSKYDADALHSRLYCLKRIFYDRQKISFGNWC